MYILSRNKNALIELGSIEIEKETSYYQSGNMFKKNEEINEFALKVRGKSTLYARQFTSESAASSSEVTIVGKYKTFERAKKEIIKIANAIRQWGQTPLR